MPSSNPETQQLRQAINKLAPEETEQVMLKYNLIYRELTDSIARGLAGESTTSYEQAIGQIDQISKDLIEYSKADLDRLNESERASRRELVKQFSDELDLINSTFNLTSDVSEYPEYVARVDIPKNVRDAFATIDEGFKTHGVFFPQDQYIEAYLACPFEKRIPPARIAQGLSEVLMQADMFPALNRVFEERYYDIMTIIGLYCNGELETADSKLAEFIGVCDEFQKIEGFRLDADIPELDFEYCSILVGFLEGNGIPIAEGLGYVKRLKSLEDFSDLKLSPDDMVEFLVASIISYRSEGQRGIDLVERKLHVEASLSSLNLSLTRNILNFEDSLNDNFEWLTKEREEHPKTLMSLRIAQCEYWIAKNRRKIINCKRWLAISRVQYELAMQYLDKPNIRPGSKSTKAVLDKILATSSSKDLATIIGRYGLFRPASFLLVVAQESDLAIAETEERLKRFMVETRTDEGESGNPATRRGIYDRFLRTGEIDEGSKHVLTVQAKFELENNIAIFDRLTPAVKEEHRYLASLKYKKISEVPESEREQVASRAQGYLEVLQRYYLAKGKIQGAVVSLDLLGAKGPDITYLDFENDTQEVETWDEQVANSRNYLGNVKSNIEIVANFLEIEDFKVRDVDLVSMSSMNENLLNGEFIGFGNKMDTAMGRISHEAGRLDRAYTTIQNFDPESPLVKARLVRFEDHLKDGIEVYDRLFSTITDGRTTMEDIRAQLLAARSTVPENCAKHPHLIALRSKMIEQAVSRIDALLAAPPFAQEFLAQLTDSRAKMEGHLEEMRSADLKMFLATLAIIAVAVASAGALSWAAGAGAGAGAAWLVGGGAVLTTGAKVAIGASALIGASAGATLGVRGGMHFSDWAIGTKFQEQGAIKWDAASLAKDFGINLVLSGAILGAARGTVVGLRAASVSRFAGIRNFGAYGLTKLQFLRTFSAPHLWFGGAARETSKKLLVRAGASFGREYGEELVQEGAGHVHPALGFFAGILAAADGIDIQSSKLGLDAKALGLSVEGDQLAFNNKTPIEFIANLKAHYGRLGITDYDISVEPDGSVTVNVLGTSLYTSGEITIHPATKGVSPEVEVSRVYGIETNPDTGELQVTTIGEMVNAATTLRATGFLVSPTADGFTATKGDQTVEVHGIEVRAGVLLDIESRIADSRKGPLTAEELEHYAVNDPDLFEGLMARMEVVDLSPKELLSIVKAQTEAGIGINRELLADIMLRMPATKDLATAENVNAFIDKAVDVLPVEMQATARSRLLKFLEVGNPLTGIVLLLVPGIAHAAPGLTELAGKVNPEILQAGFGDVVTGILVVAAAATFFLGGKLVLFKLASGVLGLGAKIGWWGTKKLYRTVKDGKSGGSEKLEAKKLDPKSLPGIEDTLKEIVKKPKEALGNLSADSKLQLETFEKKLKEKFEYLEFLKADDGISLFKLAIKRKYIELRIAELNKILEETEKPGKKRIPKAETELTDLRAKEKEVLEEFARHPFTIDHIGRAGLKRLPRIVGEELEADLKAQGFTDADIAAAKEVVTDMLIISNRFGQDSSVGEIRRVELKLRFWEAKYDKAVKLAGPKATPPDPNASVRVKEEYRAAKEFIDIYEGLKRKKEDLLTELPVWGINEKWDRMLPHSPARRAWLIRITFTAATAGLAWWWLSGEDEDDKAPAAPLTPGDQTRSKDAEELRGRELQESVGAGRRLSNPWGNRTEQQSSENPLTEELKSKGFHYDDSGNLKRKDFEGKYFLQPDGAIIYLYPDNKTMKRMPAGGDLNATWQDYTGPIPGASATFSARQESTETEPEATPPVFRSTQDDIDLLPY